MASDSDSDVPLGQRASQAPKRDSAAGPAKPSENAAASTPAGDEGSDDEPIGAKFAATVLAPGVLEPPPPFGKSKLQHSTWQGGARPRAEVVDCAAGEPPEVKAEAEMRYKQQVAAAADGGGDAGAAKSKAGQAPSAAAERQEKPTGKADADAGNKQSAPKPKVQASKAVCAFRLKCPFALCTGGVAMTCLSGRSTSG